MDGNNTILVTEDRNFVNKAKAFYHKEKQKLDELRSNYNEKYVETGKSKQYEEKIIEKGEKRKKAIRIAGTLATIALVLCPADGPFGEICAVFATPGLCKLVDLCTKIEVKSKITAKRAAEKVFLKADGNSDEIEGYDLQNGEIVDDINSLINEYDNFPKRR